MKVEQSNSQVSLLAFNKHHIITKERKNSDVSSPNLKLNLSSSDNSTTSTILSDDFSSSNPSSTATTSVIKFVRFIDEVTVIPTKPYKKYYMEKHWFSKADIKKARQKNKKTCQRKLQGDPRYREAIEHVRALLARKNAYDIIDLDKDSDLSSDDDNDNNKSLNETEWAATVLAQGKSRGLERIAINSNTYIMGYIHNPVIMHRDNVLQMYRLLSMNPRLTPDERAKILADNCHTRTALLWAQTLASIDAEAVLTKRRPVAF